MLNRQSSKLASKILNQFKQNFNVHRLYQQCYRLYKNKCYRTKYSNFMSHLHLINARVLKSSKEDQFISDWLHKMYQNKNYLPAKSDIPQLMKILQLLYEKDKQISDFTKILQQITSKEWESLQKSLLQQITKLRNKIENSLKNLQLKQKPTGKKQQQDMFQFILQPKESKKKTYRQNISVNEASVNKKQKDNHRTLIFTNQHGKNYFSNIPYIASTIKLNRKPKTSIIRLLSQQEIEQIRKSLIQQNRTTITNNQSVYYDPNSELSTANKMTHVLRRNITQQLNLNEQCTNHNIQSKSKKCILQNALSQNQTDPLKRKNLCSKNYRKHKKVSINNELNKEKYQINMQLINNFKDKTNQSEKKLVVQELKYNDVKDQTENQGQQKPFSEDGYRALTITQQESANYISDIDIIQVISKFQKDHSNIGQVGNGAKSIKNVKEPKFKRRLGISPKIKQLKSTDYLLPRKEINKKKISAFVNYNSFFRSSGITTVSERKTIPKNKYKSQNKFRFYPDDLHLDNDMNSNLFEIPSSIKLNKRKLITEPHRYYVDRKEIISDAQITTILGGIHDQEKQNKKSDKLDCYFKAKLSGMQQICKQDDQQIRSNSFKIEQIQETYKNQGISVDTKQQSRLFDFMNKNIRQSQKATLLQCSISQDHQQIAY